MIQPAFWAVENLGDYDPLTHGGSFLMVDRRGSYDPELWIYEEWSGEDPHRRLYQMTLEQCFRINNDVGEEQVGANRYHPHLPEWFGTHERLTDVANFIGTSAEELAIKLCGNAHDRARAYMDLISYHGPRNFCPDPQDMTKREATTFINKMLRQIKQSQEWK
jgi:hypothetical protein